MSIDRFTTERFEMALPVSNNGHEAWTFDGMEQGERVYHVHAGPYARVVVRSSIDESGFAAESGQDSIRLWLEVLTADGSYRPCKKLDTYTTRVNGWEDRMYGKIRELMVNGEKVKRVIPLGSDGKPQGFWFTKGGKNIGRPASKDFSLNAGFVWMDEPAKVKQEVEAPRQKIMSQDVEDAEEELGAASLEDFMKQAENIANEAFEKKAAAAERRPSTQQAAAIFAPIDKPIRVIAAAGSGKTFILERRVQYLLEKGAEPEEIVVVTFTSAMSKDMANRIISLNPEIAGTAGENQICSIHAFCNRVLHANGYGKRIPDKQWEVKRIIQNIATDLWPYVQESDKSTCRPSWEELGSVFASSKNMYIHPGEGLELYSELWGQYHAERLVKARERFDLEMGAKNWWTFGDMLYEMEKWLDRDRSFRERVQGQFKYILIDEGQDTNGQAMRILTKVAEPENQIFIVGDPDQLLFRFTGATPEANLQDGFVDRYNDGLTFFSETNYRSTHEIVNRSNQLISYNYEVRGGRYDDALRKDCVARDDAEQGIPITHEDYLDAQDEAENVANDIANRLYNGEKPENIFIASRTRAQLAYLEPPLTKLGVPFINITGGSFWLLRHVNAVLSYMRLAIDGNDEDSFRRIYNISSNRMEDRYGEYCATRWLGNSFLREVNRTYSQQASLRAVNKYRGWTEGIIDLVWTMDHVTEMVAKANDPDDETTPGDVVKWIVDNSVEKWLRYEEGLKDDDDIGKLADLLAVSDIARRFKTVEAFFEKVDQAVAAANDAKNKNWDKYVVLSTVHRLKGMERPIVYGIGWVENSDPIGILPHTYSLTDPPNNGVLQFGGKSRIEDERCIAYVLVTRAQKECHISSYQIHMNDRPVDPSRFVYELLG